MAFVYLYIVQLIFRPQDFSSPFMGWPMAWLTLFPGFFLGFKLNGEVLVRKKIPQFYLLPFFLGVIFISTVYNAGLADFYPPTATFLKRILVFYMIVFLVDSEQKLRGVLTVFMALAGLLGVHAILQLTTGTGFGGITPLMHYNPPRAVWCGEWDGSNSFGVIFLLAIPLCLEFLFSRSAPGQRIVAGVSLPLCAMGIYYVDSRGDTLALMAAMLLYIAMRFSRKRVVLVMIMAFILTGAVLPSRMSKLTVSESSAHQREWVWEQGIDLLRDNPVLGVGPGKFVKHTESGLIAHSNYVSIFSETGLTGFFGFMAILWFTFKELLMVNLGKNRDDDIDSIRMLVSRFFSNRADDGPGQGPDLTRALLCSLSGFCVATMFIVLLNDLLFFVLGLCAASYIISRGAQGHVPLLFKRSDLRTVAALMAGVIFLYWLVAVYEIF